VRITQFSDSTPADLDLAMTALHPAGHPALRGLVLDLRGNPGGVLESATSVADEFIDSGVIVRAEGRAPDARFEIDATPGDALNGAPLVVLVDAGSASGSEIVAGALRDHGRATLMASGRSARARCRPYPLRDGQALKLTTSRYFTPSGASIHQRGLEPDVAIASAALDPAVPPMLRGPASADPVVKTALQYLRDRGLGPRVAQAPSGADR
jgi:carboxyl-terminal processing protease